MIKLSQKKSTIKTSMNKRRKFNLILILLNTHKILKIFSQEKTKLLTLWERFLITFWKRSWIMKSSSIRSD